MQRRVIACALMTLLVLVASPSAQAEYYYGGSGQINLRVDTAKVCLKFDTEVPQEWVIESVPRLDSIIADGDALDGFVSVAIAPGGGLYEFLDTLNRTSGIEVAEPYYYINDSLPAPVGDELVIAFEANISRDSLSSILHIYGADTVRELEYLPNVFVARNLNPQTRRLLTLANDLHALPGIRYSHPIFGLRPVLCSYKLFDHYQSHQWHVKKVIGQFNSQTVWDFSGVLDTIVVAVIDEGVTIHEDLPQVRILNGRDFSVTPYDTNPAPGPWRNHGMACSGIIAASHTTDSLAGLGVTSGVISMSPAIKILPVKIFGDDGQGVTHDHVASAIAWAYENGADILSNSWAYITGDDLYADVDDALDRAALFGRDGKGCPIIFASGNFEASFICYPSFRLSCYAVGALTSSDTRWYYSQYGMNLDIMAPSGMAGHYGDVWTLDQMDSLGYNPTYPRTWNCDSPNDINYDCLFGGTSAACPVVAGAAALILSRSESLSRTEVCDILDHSAVPLGTGSPNLEYGHGRVDAFRAVLSIARGDADNSGGIDINDLTRLIDYMFISFEPPFPTPLLGDCNCDGQVEASGDLTYMVNFLFLEGPPPVIPCFHFEVP